MKNAFDRAIRQVQWRCHANLLLEYLVWALFAAGLAMALAAAGQSLFVTYRIQPWMACALVGAAVVAAGIAWGLRRSGPMTAAILLDRRLGLRERFSTALALSASDDPFAQAAVVEAHEAAKRVQVHGQFPIRVGRHWISAAASWLVAGALMFLPPMDLLGLYKQEKQKQDQVRKVEEARAEVKKELDAVKAVVNKMGEKDLAGELAKLDQAAAEGMKPDDVKRQAVKKLEEIAGKMEKKDARKIDTLKELQDRLKGLRGTPDGLNNELNRALAKGDLDKAAQIAKEMQNKLDEGKLDKDQQEAMKKQLQDLAKQLEGLASKTQDLEDALAKAGLDKDLAKLDKDKLKEQLEKQGLSQEQIDQLMEKLAASDAAREAMKKLAQAMAQAGEASGQGAMSQELAELADQLDEIEAQLQDMELAAANLDELKRMMIKMGGEGGMPGECDGEGAIGEWAEGLVLRQGKGTGGPGIGAGKRPSNDGGDVAFQKEKVTTPVKDGPAIASTFVKGGQVKGESQKQFKEIVQAAKDAAADAITENQIPKKYEGAIKEYFGQIDKK